MVYVFTRLSRGIKLCQQAVKGKPIKLKTKKPVD